jgi:peptidoglycan/LPS O-acetylase OafA/YrhL
MESAKDKDKKAYKYIDALRGIAILMVIAVHVSQSASLNLSELSKTALSYGAKGVQLFFFVSAFTLFMSFHRRYGKEKHPMLNYGIRRFFRIAPMYYLAILFYVFVFPMYPFSTIGTIYNFTFVHGLSIEWINNIVPGGWSIGVEMLFYVLLPFLFFRIKNLDQAIKFFIGSMIFKAILEYLIRTVIIAPDKAQMDLFLTFYLPNQLPIFSLGIIFYFIAEKGEFKLSFIKQSTLLSLIGVLMVLLVFESKILIDNIISFGIMFLILAIYMSRTKGFLLNKGLCQIGKYSFSIYLLHFAVIAFLENTSIYNIHLGGIFSFLLQYVFVAICAIVVSAITYNLIELKGQALGRKIINKIS